MVRRNPLYGAQVADPAHCEANTPGHVEAQTARVFASQSGAGAERRAKRLTAHLQSRLAPRTETAEIEARPDAADAAGCDAMSALTLADVVTMFDAGETNFSTAYRRKVLGSLRRCGRLDAYMRAPLARIGADVDEFDELWGRGALRLLPAGFETHRQFETWRSQVRSAIAIVTGLRARKKLLKGQNDDWLTLRRELERLASQPGPVLPQSLIPFNVLAALARDAGLQPFQIDSSWLEERRSKLHARGQADAARRAVHLLNRLHEINLENTRLLPPPLLLVASASKRRSTPDLPVSLTEPLEAWLHSKSVQILHGFKERAIRCSPQTLKSLRTGVHWYISAVAARGHVDLASEPTPEDLSACAIYEDVDFAEMDDELNWQPLAPTSLKNYLKSAAAFLVAHNPNLAASRNAILKDPFFESVKDMSPRRRAWCQELVSSPKKIRRFLALPGTLFEAAQTAWDAYDTLTPIRRQQVMHLAVAAAAAILTSLPLRAQNLLDLDLFGDAPHLPLPKDSRFVSITLPGLLVKNGRPIEGVEITPKRGGDPRKILEWFIAGPRQTLLNEHIADRHRNPQKLFGGLIYKRFLDLWASATARCGIAMTPHLVRHGVASILINSDKPNYDLVCALLGDTEEVVRRHYVFLDMRKAAADAQNALTDIHKKLRI
jgi:hypothetical protein